LSVDGAGSSSPTYYTRTNAGQLVNERTTAGTYYYLMDDLGSVLKVVDSSGTVKNSYYYDPYGNSLNKSETVSNPWQFASGYYDTTTGLYKFGTRYYDPQLGRWTQMDPVGGSVGKIGSSNPYVYAGNEPTMQVDPSGRDTTSEVNCVFTAIVSATALLGGLVTVITSAFGLIGATGFAAVVASGALTAGIIALIGGVAGIEVTLIVCGVTVEQQVGVLLQVIPLIINSLH